MKNEDKKIWLFALVLLVVILGIILGIIRNNANEKILWYNYEKFSYADLFLRAKKVEDREVYWTINDIIADFVSSYVKPGETYNDASTMPATYEDYYNVLYENYRDHLGKKGYLEVSKTFLEKFVIRNDIEAASIKSYDIIDSIYLVEENIYLCNLSCDTNNTKAYIVLKLNSDEKTFEIMYME